jgi:hypothetical protein
MNELEDFDGYVESLPTMLTLLSEAVADDHVATTPCIQELRAALNAALAAAERLRLDRRRKARRNHALADGPPGHLRLVQRDPAV